MDMRVWMALLLCYAQSSMAWVLNNPYPAAQASDKMYYSSFSEQPKTFDPARSYSSNEYQFITQIYEPLLEYDYLARPYQLKPLLAQKMPEITYFDANKNALSASQRANAAYTRYRIRIQPGIRYQPHPAFARDANGHYLYLNVRDDYLEAHDIADLSDFPKTGTREVVADDFLYQIKRLADPAVSSPIAGLMREHVLGFGAFGQQLPKRTPENRYVNLNDYAMEGLHKIDAYTFDITLFGVYPQFSFWLAMPFFSPMPWEADCFYSQPGMEDENISLNEYPVGTGPFYLTENNPNSRIVLEKNPNFRAQYFPAQGSEEDKAQGYLSHAGFRLPMLDRAMYTLEKESIPRWYKFLQGYYDLSGVTTDSFDQAIQINAKGEAILTNDMKEKHIRLHKTIDPSIYYMGFNMLDPIVGGHSKRARLLRQAISIAVNYDENIAIFFNGRGQPAQGPIPPGMFGYKEGQASINPLVYQWVDGQRKRQPLSKARALLREAGYPSGINSKTGRRLKLHYDVTVTGGPDDKAQLNWVRKQFAKLGIRLVVRGTLYNRFQDKMRTGNAQIYSWGWNADYPDPENFLFLLYGPNGKVKYGGENASNYQNKTYDRLFLKMKNEANPQKRQEWIDQMVDILRDDAPWVFGMHTETITLAHQWLSQVKPSAFAMGTLKYMAVDEQQRNAFRRLWNQPLVWPFAILSGSVALLMALLYLAYRHKERQPVRRIKP